MPTTPDGESDVLDRVIRHLPEAEAQDLLGQSRMDFVTWINAYLAVHRTSAPLPTDLRYEFTRRVLLEVGGLPPLQSGNVRSTTERPQPSAPPKLLPPPVIE